jgi:hypothetical protein
VRLDKQVEWELQPKKKLYSERPFPTAEQRAEAQQQLDAPMEEMKNCPMPQSQSASQSTAPDTSHCQLSSPVINVNDSDERSAFVRKYLHAQGLDPDNPQLQHTVEQFMAPYADALKRLRSKAADLQGYPLRTTL